MGGTLEFMLRGSCKYYKCRSCSMFINNMVLFIINLLFYKCNKIILLKWIKLKIN